MSNLNLDYDGYVPWYLNVQKIDIASWMSLNVNFDAELMVHVKCRL